MPVCTLSQEGRFLRVNSALCELLGRSEDELLGETLQGVTHPDDVGVLTALMSDLQAGDRDRFHTLSRYMASDGRVIWGEMSVAAVPDSDGAPPLYVAQIIDLTERMKYEAALAAMATHDTLTGLANREGMLNEVTRALSGRHRSARSTAVLVMDLDRFKIVNDSLGHATGDALLKAAATRIEGVVRGGDLVARPGGDEFVVVMRELDDPTDAVRAAWRLVEAFRRPLPIDGVELFATASIGVAIDTNTKRALEAGDLLREADTAMYAAKAEGRDRVSIYNEDLRAIVSARLAVESDLRHALERGQLAVWYQPEVDLATGAVIAVEALLRWHHPDGSVWTADQFIDVAEDTGLILDIGDWVLRTACAQGAEWAAARPDRPITVRVNKSALQVAEACLLPNLDNALAASGLDPALLCIEITETALLRETDDRERQPRWASTSVASHRHRRLRHRLRLPALPAPLPHRRHQDRPQLRHRHHDRRAGPRDHRCRRGPREGSGHDRHRRRCRASGPGRHPARPGLPRRSGLALLQGRARRRDDQPPGPHLPAPLTSADPAESGEESARKIGDARDQSAWAVRP